MQLCPFWNTWTLLTENSFIIQLPLLYPDSSLQKKNNPREGQTHFDWLQFEIMSKWPPEAAQRYFIFLSFWKSTTCKVKSLLSSIHWDNSACFLWLIRRILVKITHIFFHSFNIHWNNVFRPVICKNFISLIYSFCTITCHTCLCPRQDEHKIHYLEICYKCALYRAYPLSRLLILNITNGLISSGQV